MTALYSPLRGTWFAGEERPVSFLIKAADGKTPQALTGFTLQFELFDNIGGTSVLTIPHARFVLANSGLPGGVNDKATMTPAKAETENLPSGNYWYNLARIDAGNTVVLSQGEWPISNIGL